MINKLLYFITGFLHCRLINRKDKDPYLERYFITSKVYLHRFVSPDVDHTIHDHPWLWAVSFIIVGEYLEKLRYGKPKIIRWFNFFGPNHFHQIINAKPGTWTLFFTGEKCKEWGFLYDDGKYQVMPSQPGVTTYKDYPIGWESGRAPL